MRQDLINIGVQKLKNFGFINVTKDNILNDDVYLFFLKRFVGSLKGRNDELDKEITELFGLADKNEKCKI